MKQIFTVAFIAAFCVGFGPGCDDKGAHSGERHGAAAGHMHEADEHEHGEDAGEHEGEAHGHEEPGEEEGSEGHHHDDELLVSLTDTAMTLAGITTDSVVMRKVRQTVLLPGEVAFDEEHTAHVAPRFAGIIREVSVALGDSVSAGQELVQIENNEHLSVFSVKAPVSGRVIEKHAVRGEFASPENSLFIIADLSKVWVLCQVNPRLDIRALNGQRANVTVPGAAPLQTEGVISYVAPYADPQTRTVTARIVLANRRGEWRPGMFVDVAITTESSEAVPSVKNGGVQVMNTSRIVFIPDGRNTFKPVSVTIGRADESFTEITGGMAPGAVYVAGGAFELKAHLVTKTLGEHAGHGH